MSRSSTSNGEAKSHVTGRENPLTEEMESPSRIYKHKPKGPPGVPQKLLQTLVPTRGATGTDFDWSSYFCSRHRQLWTWLLESFGQEGQGLPMTRAHSPPSVAAMQEELLTDLLRKCAEYDQKGAERQQHKEHLETWRQFMQAAVEYAWDKAKNRNAAMDGPEKHLTEEMEEQREEMEVETSPVVDEAPPVLIGLPPDDQDFSTGSEKKRRDHMCRQERRERVRRWVKEQRELVVSQREAKKHVQVQVPRNVARTWLDQLKQQAVRERCEFRSRCPGTVSPTSEPRRYPWEDYLREKNGKLVPK